MQYLVLVRVVWPHFHWTGRIRHIVLAVAWGVRFLRFALAFEGRFSCVSGFWLDAGVMFLVPS